MSKDGESPVSIYYLDDHPPDYITKEETAVVDNNSVQNTLRPTLMKKLQDKENLKRIDRLAQPRKPFPEGSIRRNQKEKTIAFGQTTNISQCIEGLSLKDKIDKETVQPKQTLLPQTTFESAIKEKKMDLIKPTNHKETNETSNMSSPFPSVSETFMWPEPADLLQQIKEQVETALSEKLQALSPLSRENMTVEINPVKRKDQLLQGLKEVFNEDTSFVHSVMQLCTNTISQMYHEEREIRYGYVNGENIKPLSHDIFSPQMDDSENNDSPRNSRVVERMTFECYYKGQSPYSVDAATFLQNRMWEGDNPISNYREGTSVVLSESNGYRGVYTKQYNTHHPISRYQLGNSGTFAEDNQCIEDHNIYSEEEYENNVSSPGIDYLDGRGNLNRIYRNHDKSRGNIDEIAERTDRIKEKYKHLLNL